MRNYGKKAYLIQKSLILSGQKKEIKILLIIDFRIMEMGIGTGMVLIKA